MRWNTSSSRIMKMLLSSSPRAGAVNVPAQLLRWVSEHLPATVSCYSSTAPPPLVLVRSQGRAHAQEKLSTVMRGERSEKVRSPKRMVSDCFWLLKIPWQESMRVYHHCCAYSVHTCMCTCVDGNMWQAESWLLMNLSVSMSWKEGNKKGIFVDYTKYWFICW